MAKIAYRLKHRFMTGDFVEHFYDGELPVKDGVIEIPDNRKHWLGAAWMADFQLNPDTGKMYGGLDMVPTENQKKMAALRAAKDAKAAKAAEKAQADAAEQAEKEAAEKAGESSAVEDEQADESAEPAEDEQADESAEPAEVTDGSEDDSPEA